MHFFALAGPRYAWSRVAVKQFVTKRPRGMSGGLTDGPEDQKNHQKLCGVYVFLFRFDCPISAMACLAWATCHSAARM